MRGKARSTMLSATGVNRAVLFLELLRYQAVVTRLETLKGVRLICLIKRYPDCDSSIGLPRGQNESVRSVHHLFDFGATGLIS
jgi:hypothetical protein